MARSAEGKSSGWPHRHQLRADFASSRQHQLLDVVRARHRSRNSSAARGLPSSEPPPQPRPGSRQQGRHVCCAHLWPVVSTTRFRASALDPARRSSRCFSLRLTSTSRIRTRPRPATVGSDAGSLRHEVFAGSPGRRRWRNGARQSAARSLAAQLQRPSRAHHRLVLGSLSSVQLADLRRQLRHGPAQPARFELPRSRTRRRQHRRRVADAGIARAQHEQQPGVELADLRTANFTLGELHSTTRATYLYEDERNNTFNTSTRRAEGRIGS